MNTILEAVKDEVAKTYTIPTNDQFALESGIKEMECSSWKQLINYAKIYAHEEGFEKLINRVAELFHKRKCEEELKELSKTLENEIDFKQVKLFRALTEYERGRHEQSEHIIKLLTKDNTEIK